MVERLVIEHNGDVGIGTTNPASKLHIHNGNLVLSHPNGQQNIEISPNELFYGSGILHARRNTDTPGVRISGRYTPACDYTYIQVNRRLRRFHPRLMEDIVNQLLAIGASVERDDTTDLLLINGEYAVSVVLCRCRQTPAGSLRWLLRLDQSLLPDITIAVRMEVDNESPADFYLFPHVDISVPRLLLAECNGPYIDTFRFETLDYFMEMAVRTRIEVAA